MYSIDEILNDEIDDIQEDNVLSDRENEDGDLENVQEGENQEDEAEEVKKDVKDDDDVKKSKPKRQINRVNLNAERLKGPRGLNCMESTFSKLKFHGKGHEQKDLDTVMSALQHWCHRLYPKFTFDDTLEQIERLGTKKSVVVLRKKIIMNMFEDEPVPNQDDDDDPITQPDSPPSPVVDKFDSLFDDRPALKQREPSPEIQLTEEQLAIMERNRILAAERRKAKMAKEKENLESKDNENLDAPISNKTVEKSIVSETEIESMVE